MLDSSVALSWCFKDEQTPETVGVLSMAKTRAIFVPPIWHVEMSNILGMALRKGRLNKAEVLGAIGLFAALELHTDSTVRPTGPGTLVPLMQLHRLTAYDAAYLELALRLNLPLATLDKQLAAAASNAGVALILPSS
ncbi:type II toxin-antitoxin system VapC family toxin [Granulicella rosea]|uniref:type II toxin-antitoxin system VapC family toxin n=1 Tax=Granulicella rosea TaxID=474952 RepID=UPI001FEB8264|nr:type II toxin-antitoxin system VapC family toxin [Granulicella rosea]